MMGANAPVIYVLKRDAKIAKCELEAAEQLERSLRMVPCQNNAEWIAIPVTNDTDELKLSVPIQGTGIQDCPCSSRVYAASDRKACSEDRPIPQLMAAIVETQQALCTAAIEQSAIISKLETLGEDCCPSKIEVLGLDRTIVIPLKALRAEDMGTIHKVWEDKSSYESLWKTLADQMDSHRVIRRGEIDPESPIRQSQYQLLWYAESFYQDREDAHWIKVKEDGIFQTFHVERLMFSRGNITEKMRFGRKLVQPGERVLDLYAGIGYFSLPAAVHGQAAHVTCCEWNPHAVEALKRNITLNRVEHITTVIQADCRTLKLDPVYERVSLGLIPSSEGGWPVAVRSLSKQNGGWLHIHGNVPTNEIDSVWAPWVALRIKTYVENQSWSVIVHRVERVKSYAPRIMHCVADVRVGPSDDGGILVGAVDTASGIVRSIQSGETPSCALSDNGVLHQEWMRPLK